MFQTTYTNKKKREPTNKLRDNPTVAIRSKLSPEARIYLNQLKRLGKRNEFINNAIEMRVKYETNTYGFLYLIQEQNFELSKHLNRKIGNKKYILN